MIYKGEWTAETNYSPLDIVTRNGESYCTTSREGFQSNIAPDLDPDNWFKIARKARILNYQLLFLAQKIKLWKISQQELQLLNMNQAL